MSDARCPFLEVTDLCCVLAGQQVLDHVSFTLCHGEILGVMGMSGAGKSTLLRNIMGLIKPTSGEIVIDGVRINDLNETGLNEVRAKMGMCFQYAALFDSMSVFDNVAFGLRRRKMPLDEIKRRVADSLETVGLAGTGEQMPAQLSGGMRKRVGLARTLATRPELVLYDEPTSGLDPILAASIDALIMKSRDRFGVASIVVTHDVEHLFKYADNALLLYQSKAIEYGAPQSLNRSTNPIVRQFINGSIEGPIQV